MSKTLHDKKFGYKNGNSLVQWDIKDIWTAVKNKPTIIRSISLFRFQLNSVQKHYTKRDHLRIEQADISYPVVISDSDLIIDGYHRLAKLEKMGKTTAVCVVLDKMPNPIFVRGEPFEVPGLPPFEWKHK